MPVWYTVRRAETRYGPLLEINGDYVCLLTCCPFFVSLCSSFSEYGGSYFWLGCVMFVFHAWFSLRYIVTCTINGFNKETRLY